MRLAVITASVLTMGTLAMFGCSTGSSSDSASTGTTTADIQNGANDTTHKFAMGVCMGTGPGRCEAICSGALILPNVVATARHCVSESPEMVDCSKSPEFGADRDGFYVTTGAQMFSASVATAPKWIKATAYRPTDKHMCGNDIALLVLDTPIDAAEATPITPGIQRLMWDAPNSQSFTAIGYGRTSPESTGGNAGAGTRRILENIDVQCIPGSPQMDCPKGYPLADGEFIGGSGTCNGDSGSSAYDQKSFDAGNPVSFGVLSRGGTSEDGTQCQGSIYSRFDAHRDFVLDVAKTASKNWTLYPEPSWTAYVAPPPGAKFPGDGTGAATPTAPKAKTGDACKHNKDCDSSVCIDPDGSGTTVCADACKDDKNCDVGFTCYKPLGACIEEPDVTPVAKGDDDDSDVTTETNGTLPTSTMPKTETVTSSACSFSGTSTNSGSSAGWLVGLGLAIAAIRRRKP